MTYSTQSPTNQTTKGFTLLELIITIVLIGIAGSIAIVGLSSLSGIGQERKTIVDAQLAQERLELILAEKRNNGFPNPDDGADGPDPCELYNLPVNEFPACDTNNITVSFSNQFNNECYKNSTNNCTVTVSVNNGPDFIMLFYKFE